MAPTAEKRRLTVNFQYIVMPCCDHQLYWVGPRLPTFCPVCGKVVYDKLRTRQHTLLYDNNALLEYRT